jgi:hypothetical protein
MKKNYCSVLLFHSWGWGNIWSFTNISKAKPTKTICSRFYHPTSELNHSP